MSCNHPCSHPSHNSNRNTRDIDHTIDLILLGSIVAIRITHHPSIHPTMSSINQDITLTQSLADDPRNQLEKWLEDVEIHARNLCAQPMGYLRRLNPSRY